MDLWTMKDDFWVRLFVAIYMLSYSRKASGERNTVYLRHNRCFCFVSQHLLVCTLFPLLFWAVKRGFAFARPAPWRPSTNMPEYNCSGGSSLWFIKSDSMGEHGAAPIYLQGLNLLHPLTAGIPACAGPKSRSRCSAALHIFFFSLLPQR